MSSRTIEDRVAKIEKVFAVVSALAVIFGLSGAWGYKLLSDARGQVEDLRLQIADEAVKVSDLGDALRPIEEFVAGSRSLVEAARAQIAAASTKELDDIRPRVQNIVAEAAKSRLVGRAAGTSNAGHITSLGKHLTVTVRARKNDLIVADFSGSVERGEFYYRVVSLDDSTKPLAAPWQVIMASNSRWRSLSATQLFQANADGEVKLAIEFDDKDVSGAVRVFGATLVTTVIAADG